ncbi:neutral zinc metallopeptidase [Klebsiella pneumoniae]|uniref:neutral zinc metallopeptidase n=1 Tax=Klebsiella pneumoniae TaxID=573 RepID=UPI003A5CC442
MAAGTGGPSFQRSAAGSSRGHIRPRAGIEKRRSFTSVILATTEDTWGPIFEKMGRQYPQPKLVRSTRRDPYRLRHRSVGDGPFYCPADSTVYIDLSFYDEMKNKLGADGRLCPGVRHCS